MKKNINIVLSTVILSFIFFSLPSCNDETEVNMGQGYYYIPFQEVTFDVTMFGGNGIYRKDSLGHIPVVFPRILNYKYDSLYILIKQTFDFAQTKSLLKNMIFMYNSVFYYNENFVPFDKAYVINAPHSNHSGLEAKYLDSTMHIDSHIKKMIEHKVNYYIINKTKHKVMGPFTKVEFKKKRKVLHISDTLKLE